MIANLYRLIIIYLLLTFCRDNFMKISIHD